MKSITINHTMPSTEKPIKMSSTYTLDDAKQYDSGLISKALTLFNISGNAGHIIESIEVA